MSVDTIFALSTLFGKSGIAVIRISGPNAREAVDYLSFSQEIKERYACYGHIYDDMGTIMDSVLLLYFKNPRSYTGEDVIELHTHGSIAVIRRILKMLGKKYRMANPGEFSRRAFLNGKMDLTCAEGIEDLIEAESELQADQALRQMSGELRDLYEDWRNKIIDISANLEAYIDFPEDDIPQSVLLSIQDNIKVLCNEITRHLSDGRGIKIREGIYVVIIGAPNAGKSSLLNYLAKEDVSIISSISGTTRDVVEVHLNIGGYSVTLADTAGLRESKDIIEQEGVRRTRDRAKRADIKLALFDIYEKSMDVETRCLVDDNTICIASKVDHVKEIGVRILEENLELLPISTHMGYGIEELINILINKISTQGGGMSSSVPLTRERHKLCLQDVVQYLQRFDATDGIECAAEELRHAINSIGRITGEIVFDDILDTLFQNFCIGK